MASVGDSGDRRQRPLDAKGAPWLIGDVAGVPDSPEEDLAVSVGARIRELRQARGLSLQDVVDRGGVSAKAHLSHLERGRLQPTLGTLARIASCLDTSVRDLLPPPAVDRAELLARVAELPDDDLRQIEQLVVLLARRRTDA